MVSDEDADPDGLQAEADSEAKLRERIFTLRRQGGLVRPPNDWSPEDFNQKDYYQGNDLWSEIVESAVAAAQARSDAASAQEHASRVAAKIRAHWEGIALKEDKARAAEERRLRQMAKFTIKMVVGEWKKAVFVSDGFRYPPHQSSWAHDDRANSTYENRTVFASKRKSGAVAANTWTQFSASLVKSSKLSTKIYPNSRRRGSEVAQAACYRTLCATGEKKARVMMSKIVTMKRSTMIRNRMKWKNNERHSPSLWMNNHILIL